MNLDNEMCHLAKRLELEMGQKRETDYEKMLTRVRQDSMVISRDEVNQSSQDFKASNLKKSQ